MEFETTGNKGEEPDIETFLFCVRTVPCTWVPVYYGNTNSNNRVTRDGDAEAQNVALSATWPPRVRGTGTRV